MATKINKKRVKSYGIKFFVEKDGKEIGRAFLYIMNNGLKKEPFGQNGYLISLTGDWVCSLESGYDPYSLRDIMLN